MHEFDLLHSPSKKRLLSYRINSFKLIPDINFVTKSTFVILEQSDDYCSQTVNMHSLKLRKEVAKSYGITISSNQNEGRNFRT